MSTQCLPTDVSALLMPAKPRINKIKSYKAGADKSKPNSSMKRTQLEIKINTSFMFDDDRPTLRRSQTISFRLNPPPSSTTNKSEIYLNRNLMEKISQLEPKLHADLSNCSLTDRDMSIVVDQIIRERKCTELWLYGNRITARGASSLASSLANNSSLKSLDLSFNQLSDSGVHALAEMLCPSLKILYLSRNDISRDGAKDLADMLRTNRTLTELWLSDNEIDDEGLKQLAHALTDQNRTLKILSLSRNRFITDVSIDYLIGMLEHNQILKKLWLSECSLTEQGKSKLKENAEKKKPFEIVL